MDVVYPLSKSSQWSNHNELRYSLRSVEKFVPVRNVYLIGFKPEWATNVIHIPFSDFHVVKDANIISKVLRACYEDLTAEFIRLSDDQYFLTPYKKAYYYKPDLQDGEKQWLKRCFNTKDVLLTQKKPIYNYDCHVPQLIDKKKYVDIMLQATWGQGVGLLVNSYYFNTLFSALTDEHQIPDKVNDFLSLGEKIDDDTKKRLVEIFPYKSRYEH